MSSLKPYDSPVTPVKRSRGRPPKNKPQEEYANISQSTTKANRPKPVRKKSTKKVLKLESDTDTAELEDDEVLSEDEFKPESEKSWSESEEKEDLSEEEIIPKKVRLTRSQRIQLAESSQENLSAIDEFNKEEKISQWDYELDSESQVFKKPKIPNLTDNAIKPFISTKSKPPKLIIYECLFCERVFTYPLVFKSHLYSCELNKNVPEYILYCIKCDYKSKKKQDMLNHYTDKHLKDENLDHEDESKFELTTCKKNQLKATSYLFIDQLVFKFTRDYFSILFEMNKNLKKIDQLLKHEIDREYTLNESMNSDSDNLNFEYNNFNFNLKSFESHQVSSKHTFKIINLVEQITSLDWCPSAAKSDQYMAVSTLPNRNLLDQIVQSNQTKFKTILEIYTSPNLIYILKFCDLNTVKKIKKFALLNKQIGHISQVKWRPDFGKSACQEQEYIGYLLACGSDGNGYIYRIKDMCDQVNEDKKLFCYEPRNWLVLKPSFSYGQCTSGDWSMLNGACQIALGYSNGSFAIYQLNSNSILEKQDLGTNKNFILPKMVINAHFTFIKTIKWSKLNSSVLCTGSIFSREIKLWNLSQPNKAVIDYEIFSTDFEFNLHSNDLLISKEINLKGENHMVALTLEFNLINNDKDESRAHSSLFYTNSTMNSINQSDYFNKFLLCDNDGSVVLCRSDNSKYWVQKNKLMCNTFSKIAKFVVNENEKNKENAYNLSYLSKKTDKTISICLDHSSLKPGSKQTSNQLNSIGINLNNLSKIRWNQNLGFLNWYACASLSGFLFIQKIEELNN